MRDHSRVISLAAQLLGTLTAQQQTLLDLVVDAVQQEIDARLRPDTDRAQCEEALTLAAVLLSVSAMRQLKETDISDFTAGTLKVSLRDDRSAYAQTAERLLAPWCAGGIAFRGVSG